MIIGVGIDIVKTERIKKTNLEKFINRLFNEEEIDYINKKKKKVETIAGMFSAKEAVSKMLGTGIRNYKWKDIIIYHDKYNKPFVELKNNAKSISSSLKISNITLSITHEKDYAFAVAIGENDKKNKNKFSYDNSIIRLLPKRDKNTHKGDYGRVGIIAGSIGMTGASYLTSMSALRTGTGLVYLYIPKSLNSILEIKTTEVITKPLEDNNKGYFINKSLENIDRLDNYNVLAVGPGLGQRKETIEFINKIVKNYEGKLVLDADGINIVSKKVDILKKRKGITIITPHPGELSRLIGTNIKEIQKNRIKYAIKVSKEFKVIVVLKGHNTVVAYNDLLYVNNTGNPGMATAGSGDVLTGIISSFIAQGINEFDACRLGVYLHGLSGDYMKELYGEYGLLASDILEGLPKILKKIRRSINES